jgi:hypothetical protein
VSETPIDERRFTDREVREILKRAVESRPSQALVKHEGLSLGELKAIGEEVGIDPARLEEAARSVVVGKRTDVNPLIGVPTVLDFERKIEGEFDPDDAPEILAVIRRWMGEQGEISEIRGSLEWSAKSDTGSRYVTVSAKDGTTTVRSSANLSNAAVLGFVPGGALGFFAAIAGTAVYFKEGELAGLILGLTILPLLYWVTRIVLGRFSSSESRKLQGVVDELAASLETTE